MKAEKDSKLNMSAFADLADAATRSSVGHLFRQLLLATPKTRGLTMTLTRAGDLKFSSYPVQQPSRRAATQQQSRSSPKGGPPQRSAPHAPPRRVADRAAVERAGQPPPFPKPSTAKEEQAPHPGVPAPAAPLVQPAAPPPAQPALDPGAPPPPQQTKAKGHEGPLLAQPAQVAAPKQAPPPASAADAVPPPDVLMDGGDANELPTDSTAAAEAAPAAPVAPAEADPASLPTAIEAPVSRRLEPSGANDQR